MSSASEPAPVPVGQTREFWILMGYALLLGVVGALAGLVFLGVTDAGNNWYDVSDPGWFGGHWWWVAVTAGAGVVVGLLRSVTKLPAKIPGLIADIESAHVDTRLVPGIVAVSAVSLIGGASLGPEQALGAMGGGAATWIARRKRPRQGRRRGERPERLRRRLRRAVLEHRDRGDADPGGCPPRRSEIHQGACRRDRRFERLVRDLLRDRRRSLP